MKKAVALDGGLFARREGNVFLGIDQSYTGFAVTAFSAEDDTFFSWVYKGKNSGIDRLIDIQTWFIHTFLDIEKHFVIKGVAMEGYAHGAKFGREQAGELASIIKLTLRDLFGDERGYPCIIPPTNLKKFVCGKANAISKEQMLLQTFKKYGVEFSDNNMCDSYGLARMISALNSDAEALLGYERDALAKLTRHTEWNEAKK